MGAMKQNVLLTSYNRDVPESKKENRLIVMFGEKNIEAISGYDLPSNVRIAEPIDH